MRVKRCGVSGVCFIAPLPYGRASSKSMSRDGYASRSRGSAEAVCQAVDLGYHSGAQPSDRPRRPASPAASVHLRAFGRSPIAPSHTQAILLGLRPASGGALRHPHQGLRVLPALRGSDAQGSLFLTEPLPATETPPQIVCDLERARE